MVKYRMPSSGVVFFFVVLAIQIPLSIFAGIYKWAGPADLLPFVQISISLIYIFVEGIRLAFPRIMARNGVLLGLSMVGPAYIFCPEDLSIMLLLIFFSGLIAYIISLISFFINGRKVNDICIKK
jgi:hypothetical protein